MSAELLDFVSYDFSDYPFDRSQIYDQLLAEILFYV